MTTATHSGPLAGLRVVELGGIGPGPFAATLLADMGADVLRVDRDGPADGLGVADVLHRGRRRVVLDLRQPDAVGLFLELIEEADVLLEGYRPGVTERLGVGPDVCMTRNPGLVYARMTGWGQDGPWAPMAGHDINYLALSGVLHALGRKGEPPAIPLNLLGDFGGGSTYLVMGVLAALWEAQRSGNGQVVDAAIVDGAASLSTMLHGMLHSGTWRDERGVNLLDTGCPWYDVYGTADGGWMSVGALENRFYRTFAALLELPEEYHRRPGPDGWIALRGEIARRFVTRTRDEWTQIFEGTDACVAPVLSLRQAATHPHLIARRTFVSVAGVTQPAPAPRFARTPGVVHGPPATVNTDPREVLHEWRGEGTAVAGSTGSTPVRPRNES